MNLCVRGRKEKLKEELSIICIAGQWLVISARISSTTILYNRQQRHGRIISEVWCQAQGTWCILRTGVCECLSSSWGVYVVRKDTFFMKLNCSDCKRITQRCARMSKRKYLTVSKTADKLSKTKMAESRKEQSRKEGGGERRNKLKQRRWIN